jgi:hypothetical protein
VPADIFLGSHSSWFALNRKFRERATAKDPADPFIDHAGYLQFIDVEQRQFQEALAEQQRKR